MSGVISIYSILSHYQASIWNQSWIHSSTVALNYKMFAWGLRTQVFCNPPTPKEGTFQAISPKLFAIVSEMCSEGAPKPNLNPLLMYNTSVWHSWASARPFKATLIFFYLQSCKSEEGKGDERLRILTQPWQISSQSTYSVLLFCQNPEEGLEESPDVLAVRTLVIEHCQDKDRVAEYSMLTEKVGKYTLTRSRSVLNV